MDALSVLQISVLMEILQDYFGLVEVPVWRHVPEDTQFLYTTLDNLSTAPIPLVRFHWEMIQKKTLNTILLKNDTHIRICSHRFICKINLVIFPGKYEKKQYRIVKKNNYQLCLVLNSY